MTNVQRIPEEGRGPAQDLTPHTPTELQAYYQEDEISLIDLWLVLVRRRRLAMLVALMVFTAGSVFAYVTPKKYKYYTTLEIGTMTVDDGENTRTRLIDPPETLRAKIEESYIPLAEHRYYSVYPEDSTIYKLTARVPKSSEVVVIEGQGPKTTQKTYLGMLQDVVDEVAKDHARATESIRSALETELAKGRLKLEELQDPGTLQTEKKQLQSELRKAELDLEDLKDERVLAVPLQNIEAEIEHNKKVLLNLKDQEHLFQAQYKRLDEVDQLLRKQINELQDQINTSLARRKTASEDVKDPAMAMAMLMLDNETQQNRLRLANLEERLFITQKNERETLENKLEDNRREQEVQRKVLEKVQGELVKLSVENERAQKAKAPEVAVLNAKIAKLEADSRRAIAAQKETVHDLETKLQNLRETRALLPPVASLEPTGPRKLVVIVLSIVLGGMLGIFGAFVAEFIGKAREQAQTARG